MLEIENRQALLTYSKNPQRALSLISSRLNLQFNQQREQTNQKPNLPTKLDPALISPATLNAPGLRPVSQHGAGLREFGPGLAGGREAHARATAAFALALAAARLPEPGEAGRR